MATFPNLKSGKPAMYPATRGRGYMTGTVKFLDQSEQRWKARAPLTRWELTFTGVDGYDLSLVRAFFNSMKGAFDSTWDVTIGGVLYSNCVFEQDDFSPVEQRNNRHNLTLRFRQVRKN